jgi:hypothetical protein
MVEPDRDVSLVSHLEMADASDPKPYEPKVDTSLYATEHNQYEPKPSASIPLDAPRQTVLDAVLSLYSGKPSEAACLNYASRSIYDDPLSFCDTRRKIAAQWYALHKCFSNVQVKEYEVVHSGKNPDLVCLPLLVDGSKLGLQIIVKLKTDYTMPLLGTKTVTWVSVVLRSSH